MFKNRKRKGFTLIELVIVIAIIGILAAIAIPRFSNSTEKAQNTKIEANARVIASAIATNYADKGVYPADNNAKDAILDSVGLKDKGFTITKAETAGVEITYTWGTAFPKYTGTNATLDPAGASATKAIFKY